MGTDNGGVNHPMLGVRIGRERCQHPLPHSGGTPADKAFVHAIPGAVLRRKQSPLRAAPADPFHRVETAAARLLISAYIGPRLLAHEFAHLTPVFVAQS